ncbi:hypothetical protein [Clostridium omnivorum]|uniref:Uncharacterized protein n=1 Tax=Clostridium omnivorum TaxID=1604902 RepID=A0ABQ5N8M8_9CLOT|nr:hypothetical protein [Clostridium sp. E14]GLC31501.1 hypothetical protein bsdE14_29110 [Clostridium sp. E14]
MDSFYREDISNFIHSKCRVTEEELLEKFKDLTLEELRKELYILEFIVDKPEIYYIDGKYISKHCKHLET